MEFNKKILEIIDSVENLDKGFEDILELSGSCKFSNCTHTNETDCAVKKAISVGILSKERFNNYFRDKNEAEYVSKQKNKTKAIDYMKQRKNFVRS
jgi:putative ribosome biogenesis GTPase RsgA